MIREPADVVLSGTYIVGSSRTEGAAAMKNLLGGKGANLAEMCRLGIVGATRASRSARKPAPSTPSRARSAVTELIEDPVSLKGVAFVEQEMGKTLRRRLRIRCCSRCVPGARIDARHDGHGPEYRPQRPDRRGAWLNGDERFA